MKEYKISESFGKDLSKWMTQRFQLPILSIEGGWEYWIQIDFPAWLDLNYSTQFDFRREFRYPDQNYRVDWLVNSQVSGPSRTYVEIKAQTHKYPNKNFILDVQKDYEKLAKLDKKIAKITLAAVIDQGAFEGLERNKFKQIAFWRPRNDKVSFLSRTIPAG